MRGPSISQTDARKPPCRGRREPSTPRGRTRAESRASGRHGPRRAAPRRDADRSKTGHALTSRPPRATGMCVLTAVRARVALVSRLSRPPGPGAPPGVTKSRMRIQVPACPRPQGPGPTRVQGPAAQRPAARAGYLRFCGCFDAGESRRTGFRLRKPECLISIPVTTYVPATGPR